MYRRGDLGQVARAMRVMNALRGFRRGRTLAALAAEVDVSVRTIRRDIADLVDANIRVDLVPVDGQAGARLIDRGYTAVPITTRERFTLLAVRSVFDVLRGTPLHDDVLSVLEKLEQRLDPDDVREQARMRERIAYVPDGGTKAYADKEDVIDALQTGILSQKVVRYAYKDSRGRSQRGFIAPYAMLLYRQGLYVVGCRLAAPATGKQTTDWRRRLGNFAVERFTEAEHLRESSFDVPPDFRLDDVLHGAFGIHVGDPGAPRRVVIEFGKEKASFARARVLHRTQELEDLPDGGVRFSFWCVNLTPVVSQLTRPDGSCMFYIYDSSGRLSQTKRRDDCNASSSGDYQTWSYTADSQVSEVDTYDSTGTLTAKQPYTYFNSRRLQEVVNPVDTSKFTGLVYDSAGKLTEVDGASSLSKSVYHFDGAPGRDNRVTSEERYKTSSTSDSWSLLYSWLSGQSQVTDGDSKVTGSTRDDLNRLVKITSPDFTGPTIQVYDAASRMTTMVEDQGGGSNQLTHTFTFDYLGRPLNSDFQGSCATTGTAHPEIQRTYDGLPSGVVCPVTGACTNLTGRLAYVETILMCSSTYTSTDGSLDQFTFYGYDDAGRVVAEFITDDTGRIAKHYYQYTKNGALSQVTMPSGAVLGWSFGSSGNNSDTDRVTGMWRTNTSTPVADTVQWNPYGPLKQYNWEATISSTTLRTQISRNYAYRITTINDLTSYSVTLTEDAMGRVTSRVYYPHFGAQTDSYFLYDEQSRVLCETSDSQSTCPATGSDIKNNQSLSPPFMGAGDWKQLLRPIAGSTGLTNNFNTSGTNYGSSHQVTDVNQSDGTPTFGHTAIAYNAYGVRSYDDNTTTFTNDRRDYTYTLAEGSYDPRHNVTNVRGQYYTGSAWHYYDVASAFDHKNRRVFKSFYDETTAKTAQWYFYYDALDRLTEVRYTPDISASSTYSVFQLFWLDDWMILYWQTDYPSVTTSKRYTMHDETGRIYEMWDWPSSGNASLAWVSSQTAWGSDTNLYGASVYQPLLFAGQYKDTETAAYENDGATVHRPGVVLNGFRTYDPFTGGYLQVDPLADQTWSSYVYAGSDPVGTADPTGLLRNESQYKPGAGLTKAPCRGPSINWDNPSGNLQGNLWDPSSDGPGEFGIDWSGLEQGAQNNQNCVSGPTYTPPLPPEVYPTTFVGDETLVGCPPAATYDERACGACLHECIDTYRDDYGRDCYTQQCDAQTVHRLNDCKKLQCEVGAPAEPFGPVCARACQPPPIRIGPTTLSISQ